MKIIFLDFDGVLVSGFDYFLGDVPNKAAVAALNRVIEATGASIVVSSSWRVGTSLKELQETLNNWGVRGIVIGKTPVIKYLNEPRGIEIQEFIEDFTLTDDIESFVIIDDNSDMCELKPYLVLTEKRNGLTDSDAEECIKMLNKSKVEVMAQ